MRVTSMVSAMNSGRGVPVKFGRVMFPLGDISSNAVTRLDVHPAGYCETQSEKESIFSKRAENSRIF